MGYPIFDVCKKCGSQPEFYRHDGDTWVSCPGPQCGYAVCVTGETIEDAAYRWNHFDIDKEMDEAYADMVQDQGTYDEQAKRAQEFMEQDQRQWEAKNAPQLVQILKTIKED